MEMQSNSVYNPRKISATTELIDFVNNVWYDPIIVTQQML